MVLYGLYEHGLGIITLSLIVFWKTVVLNVYGCGSFDIYMIIFGKEDIFWFVMFSHSQLD